MARSSLSVSTVIRYCVAALLLSAVVWFPALALAEPGVTNLQVFTTPTLDVLSSEGRTQILAASEGMVVRLEILARYSDGSTRDVTHDPATTYTSLVPHLVSTNPNGVLSFSHPGGTRHEAALLLVEVGGLTQPIGFNIAP